MTRFTPIRYPSHSHRLYFSRVQSAGQVLTAVRTSIAVRLASRICHVVNLFTKRRTLNTYRVPIGLLNFAGLKRWGARNFERHTCPFASIAADCTDDGAVQSAGLRLTTRDDHQWDFPGTWGTGGSASHGGDQESGLRTICVSVTRPRHSSRARLGRRDADRGTKEFRQTVLGGSCIDRGRVSLPLVYPFV